MNGDAKTRKRLEQISPGPLIEKDQLEVATLVTELSRTYFKEKPDILINYEHDILYPEAVIWALKKRYNCTLKKAEAKYLEGFKRTQEEVIKQKCNEFILKQQSTTTTESDSLETSLLNESKTAQDHESDESLPDLRPNEQTTMVTEVTTNEPVTSIHLFYS